MKRVCPNCGKSKLEYLYTVRYPIGGMVFVCYRCMECGTFSVMKGGRNNESGT